MLFRSLRTALTCAALRLDASEKKRNLSDSEQQYLKTCPDPNTEQQPAGLTTEQQREWNLRQLYAQMAQAFSRVATIELTPREAQQVLEQFGYERSPQKGWMFNSYVVTKLTQTQASNGFTLSNSPNSVHLEGGIYAPFYGTWSRWPYKGQPYAIFIAPLAKMGFDSLRLSGTDPIFQLGAQPTHRLPTRITRMP